MQGSRSMQDAGNWAADLAAGLVAALAALGGRIDRGLDRMEGRG